MKIAQVVLRYPPAIGGGAVHVKYITEELSKFSDIRVDVYTSFLVDVANEQLSLPKIEKKDKVRIFRYKFIKLLKNRDTLYVQPKIFFDIYKRKYDIIHVHGYRSFPFYGGLLASFFINSTPWIATLHHNPDFQATSMQKLHDKLVRKLMNRFAKIIALTEYEKEWLLSWGVEPEKVAVIPNGVPDNFFEEVDKIKKDEIYKFKRKLRGNEKFILSFLGRVTNGKNLYIIVKALALLPENIRNRVLFIIAGPDWGEVRKIQELARKYNIHKNIVYLGILSEREKILLLKSSDVFVMPSVLEAFSIAALEAMAAQTPVLATKSGGLQSLIKDKESGFLLNPYNPKEWAEYIVLLYEDKALRYKLGKNGRKIAENYRWSKIAKKLIKVYYEVIAGENKR